MNLFRKRRTESTLLQERKTQPSAGIHRRLSYQVSSLQMIGARSKQEDSFAIMNANDVSEIIRNGMLAIVADGMGGLSDGKQASEKAIASVIDGIRRLDKRQDIPEQLKQIILRTNRQLYEKFRGAGGTTVILLYFYDESVYWLSVGDSAIFLKRGNGLYKLNCDHNYLNQLYKEELSKTIINKENAENNPKKARLSEFVGAEHISKIDCNLRPMKLCVGDKFLLCSDGISGFIGEDVIGTALDYTPQEAVERLNRLVCQKQHPKQDNYTGLIVSVEN